MNSLVRSPTTLPGFQFGSPFALNTASPPHTSGTSAQVPVSVLPVSPVSSGPSDPPPELEPDVMLAHKLARLRGDELDLRIQKVVAQRVAA